MTQPQPTPTPTPATAPAPFRPAPLAKVSSVLRDYIQAAASGDRSSVFHLFAAVFASAQAAVKCLVDHYNANPRGRTFATFARLKYCLARIPAILYTLKHAPERFLRPAQLRALTRARAILAHIWRQPVDFTPLTPYLTSPENCPPPPRSVVAPASCRHEPGHTPHSALHPAPDASLATPHSALRTSASADPLLLRSPGCALASVLLQLAAIYGIANTPAPAPRPAAAAAVQSAPSASPQVRAQSPLANPSFNTPIAQSGSNNPQSAIGTPQSLIHSPP